VRFEQRLRDGIHSGAIVLAFRRWKRSQVVPGHRYRTGTDMVEVESVDVVEPSSVDAAQAREAASAREQAGQGHLLRLWALPGQRRALGLWQAADSAEIQAIMVSLPLSLLGWMDVQTTPLTPHPSDPALADS